MVEQNLCATCRRGDSGACPSYPAPVDHCQQYEPTQQQIADRWWAALGDKDLIDGD